MIRRHLNISSRPIYRVQITPSDTDFFIWSGTPGASVMGLWRLSDDARRFETQDPIFSQISSLGNYALSDSTRGTLRVYNANSGSVAREFVRDFNWDRDVAGARAFNPSGNRVVVSVLNTNTDAPRLLVLDVATGEPLGRFRSSIVDEEYATALAYNADGSLLLSGYENEIIVWNTETLRPIRHLTAHNETVIEVGFSSDGNYAISRSRDGNVRVWDLSLRDIAEARRIVARTQFAEVNFPGLYNNAQTVAAGVYTSMFAWNAQTGEQINRVDPGGVVINVAHSPVDNLLLMVTNTYTRLMTVPEFSTVRDLFGSEGDRYTGEAAFSPDGTMLVFGSTNNLYVRGVPNGERLATISKGDIPNDLEVTDVAITPDNRLLLVVTGDLDTVNALPGEIRVYDIATAEMLYTFSPGHTRTVKTIAVSPTGLTALTGAEDNDLILWNIETGRVLRRFVGHTGQVNRVVYSADGLNALSVSDDAAMIQWDIATGQPLRTFQGHVEEATGLALSEDGRWAVSSTGGDTMIVWQVSGQADLVGFACATRYIPTLTCIDRAQFGLEPCAPDGTPPDDDPVCAGVPETASSTAPGQ
jgi:WD40 repeat protein